MNQKSFYNLEYIIEINEKRIEEYIAAYQHMLGRFTDIIVIYSAITIFLIPICQEIFRGEISHWLLTICFTAFIILFLFSLYYAVKFIIPVDIALLASPQRYYTIMRLTYEEVFALGIQNIEEEANKLIQASYLHELEETLEINKMNFLRKSSFHLKALVLGISAAIPFLVCLGFHILKNEDKNRKIQIVDLVIRNNVSYSK